MDDDARLDEFTVEPERYEQRRRSKQKPQLAQKKPLRGRTSYTTFDDVW